MAENNRKAISRREFARWAAMVSAASMVPGSVLASRGGQFPAGADRALGQESSDFPKLTAEGRAEAEARYHAILSQYGGRFTEEQKAELRRLCALAQRPLDSLRAYPVENGDGAALYLKPLVEREKKAAGTATTGGVKNP